MKKILFVLMMLLTASVALAVESTPVPEIIVEEAADTWVVTAYGEGEVHLFIDDVEVENPYTIEQTDEEQIVVFKAYAQAEGCLPSDWVILEVYVPARVEPILPIEPDYGVNISLTDESVILEPYVDPAYFDDFSEEEIGINW